jgi:hypothetical protein
MKGPCRTRDLILKLIALAIVIGIFVFSFAINSG